MSTNHHHGAEGDEGSFDPELVEILNDLYDTSFPEGVAPGDFFQEITDDAPAHSSAQPPAPAKYPLVVDLNPTNQIYEDVTPNSTPRAAVCVDTESTGRQTSRPVEEENSSRSRPSLDEANTGSINIIDASRRGVKRLREIYGEELIYPEREENSESVTSTTGGKKRFEKYSPESPNTDEYEEITSSPERGAEVFLASQQSVLNGINSERDLSESSDEDDRSFSPLYNAADLRGLSYATLRSANRSFQRVIEIATLPLTYHQTADIVSRAQTGITDLLHRVIDTQNQHTADLRSAVEFFGVCQDRVLEENRQLRNTVLSLQQNLLERCVYG
ncbi:hypothetical protein PO909_013032 [Leuciscus waleckii]